MALDSLRRKKIEVEKKRTKDLERLKPKIDSKELRRTIESLLQDAKKNEGVQNVNIKQNELGEKKHNLSYDMAKNIDLKLAKKHAYNEIWNKANSSAGIYSESQVQTVRQNVQAEQLLQDETNEINIKMNIIEVIEKYIELYIELCDKRDNLEENIKNSKNNKDNKDIKNIKLRYNEYARMDVKELEELLSQVEQLLSLLNQKYTKFIQSLNEVQLKETTIIIDKKKTDLERKFEEVSQRYNLVKSKLNTAGANNSISEISEYIDIESDCKEEFTSTKAQLSAYTKFADKLNYEASQRQANQDEKPKQQIQDKSNEIINIHRVVIKLQINGNKPFEAGETILSDYDFHWLKTNYPNNIIEIPMSNQEWLEYLSNEVHKSYKKAIKLQMICEQFGLDVELPTAFEERTKSIFSAAIKGEMLNPKEYNGLNDVIEKTWRYITDVEVYERIIFANFNKNSKTK